jgi:hypothetical protein
MPIPGISGVSGSVLELPSFQQVYASTDTVNRATYTFSNVPIGDPHPDRRLLLYFIGNFLPGTISYSCTVNGVAASFKYADLPNGTVLSSAFSVYVQRDILYVSEPIPTGTTATVVIGTGLTCSIMSADVIRATNLRSTSVTLSEAANTLTVNVPARSGGFLATTDFSGSNSNVTISNATRDINVLSDGFYNRIYHYINPLNVDQSVTFTRSPSGGNVQTRFFS